MSPDRLKASTRRLIDGILAGLDYGELAAIYCDEGGEAFWKDRREPCRELGIRLAEVLLARLNPHGRSLYVGAGVAEIPLIVMEIVELKRDVQAFNLRQAEVAVLNAAYRSVPFCVAARDASTAEGRFDHLCMISVLNDPERFPEVSALSYGRANPASFDPVLFARERTQVMALADACLRTLTPRALITTSTEEIPWITDWCGRHGRGCVVEEEDYPTAIVGDPVCLIRLSGTTG